MLSALPAELLPSVEERSFYLFNFIPFNRVDFFVYMINFIAVIFFPSRFYVLYCVLSFCFLFLFIRNWSRFRKKLILNLLCFKISCCLSYHTCRSKFKGWSYIERIQYQKSIWDQRGKKKCRSKTATCLFNFICCNTNCKQDTTCIKSKRKLWSCHKTPPSASSHKRRPLFMGNPGSSGEVPELPP